MLIVICVKCHHYRTPASQKTNLTENFNQEIMDKQTDERTDRGSQPQIDKTN